MAMTATVTNYNHFLASLPPAEFGVLKPYLSETGMERDALLHEQGDAVRHVYFPQSGMISLVVVMNNGEGAEASTIGREGAVGMLSALNGTRSAHRAVVQLPGVMARIPALQFQKAAREHSLIGEMVLHYTEMHVAQTQQIAACNVLHNIEPRLCRWLLQTRDRVDGEVLPLTQEFLSEMLGVRRTTVTWTAQALQEVGVIRYRRGRIEVLNPDELGKMACECYDTIRGHTDAALAKTERHAAREGGG
jgi:CRP-like cAMP-binding protein